VIANTWQILAGSSGYKHSHSYLRATYSGAPCRVNLKMRVQKLEIAMFLTRARDGFRLFF
jgi:hypothetical protein